MLIYARRIFSNSMWKLNRFIHTRLLVTRLSFALYIIHVRNFCINNLHKRNSSNTKWHVCFSHAIVLLCNKLTKDTTTRSQFFFHSSNFSFLFFNRFSPILRFILLYLVELNSKYALIWYYILIWYYVLSTIFIKMNIRIKQKSKIFVSF